MILIKESTIIKDKLFDLRNDNMEYLIKTFLMILDKKKRIRILIVEAE